MEGGVVLGMSNWEEAPGQIWRDYTGTVCWKCLGILPEELEELAEVWASQFGVLPPRAAEVDEWMDVAFCLLPL